MTTRNLNMIREVLSSASVSVNNSTTNLGAVIDTLGYNLLCLYIKCTGAAFTIKAYAKLDKNSSDLYQFPLKQLDGTQLAVTPESFKVSTTGNYFIDIKTAADIPYVQLEISSTGIASVNYCEITKIFNYN